MYDTLGINTNNNDDIENYIVQVEDAWKQVENSYNILEQVFSSLHSDEMGSENRASS